MRLAPEQIWTFVHDYDGSAKFEATQTQDVQLTYSTDIVDSGHLSRRYRGATEGYWQGKLVSNTIRIVVKP